MEITKLHDKYDMQKFYEGEVMRECYQCRYCGEFYKNFPLVKRWYGRKDKLEPFSLRKLKPQKWKHWKVAYFQCYKCGAIWKSEPYEL